MNVLEIGLLYSIGGAATVMHQIAEEADCGKDKVYIIAAYNHNSSALREDDLILYNEKYESEIERIVYSLDKYRIINVITLARIIKFCWSHKIDIIHFHAVQDFIGIRGLAILCKLYPVVWTFHDCWGITGKCLHTFQCEKWKNQECIQCKKYDEIDTNLLYTLKKRSFTKRNIIFTTPSHWLKKKTKVSFLKNEKMVVIPNGINVSEFNIYDKKKLKEKYGIADKKKNILFAAADIRDKFKGFSLLEKAMEILPSNEYRLLVMGEAKQLRGFVGGCEIKKFGYVSDKRVKNEILSLADVFVIPSVQENFPCIVLEAMASGTPVIGFDVGGIPEQVAGGCGWICKERSSEVLAKTIQVAFKDIEQLEIAGKRARKKVEEQYDIKVIVGKYRQLYKLKSRKYRRRKRVK